MKKVLLFFSLIAVASAVFTYRHTSPQSSDDRSLQSFAPQLKRFSQVQYRNASDRYLTPVSIDKPKEAEPEKTPASSRFIAVPNQEVQASR